MVFSVPHLYCALLMGPAAGSSRVVGTPFTASSNRLLSSSDPEESLICYNIE